MAEIKTAKFVWINGSFVKWNEAKVHVMTHALHYGSAVFEGIHSYKTKKGTAIFRLDEHISRLLFSADALSMKINFTESQLKDAIKKLLKMNKLSDAYIRPLAYYGYGNVGVFPKDIKADVMIAAVQEYSYYKKCLRIATSRFLKHHDKSTIFGTKISGNYVNSIIAMFEARKKGYDEALMLDHDGFVSEGPVQNLLMIKKNVLIAPKSSGALLGLTRDTIMEIARGMGMKVLEKNVTLEEVKNADELFFSGTATELGPIESVDDVTIGNGKCGRITAKIMDKFGQIVRGKDKKYNKWLTYLIN